MEWKREDLFLSAFPYHKILFIFAQKFGMETFDGSWKRISFEMRYKNYASLFVTVSGHASREQWPQLGDDTLHNLVDSMPRRMAAVAHGRGGHTCYQRTVDITQYIQIMVQPDLIKNTSKSNGFDNSESKE